MAHDVTPSRSNAAFPVDRRGFLGLSALGSGMFALGSGALLSGCDGHYQALLPGSAKAQVLTPKELAVLTVLSTRLLAAPEGWPTALQTDVAGRIDRELRFHHAALVEDFKAALLLVEYGTFFHGSFSRFTRQDAGTQDAYLQALVTSSRQLERQAMASLRMLIVFFHYTDAQTWPHIGYQGPLVEKASPPPADNRRI
jgi:hypothetical protein